MVRSYRQLALSLAVLAALALAWTLTHPETKPPIRVGVLHSLTGTMAASERPLVDALQLAAEEINAQGGLLGRPVELVIADGRSDWDVFAAEAERLITQEHVSALFACWTSACRKAVLPVVERLNHLMFYPVQYEGLEQSPNIIYTGAAPNQQIIPGARWAMDTFGKRVYLVGSDYIFPHAANLLVKDLVTAAGGSILAERYRPLGSMDFDDIGADIEAQHPDVILNTVNGDSNLALFQTLNTPTRQQIPVVSFSVAEAELQAWSGPASHPQHYGVWGYFQSLPGAANQTFVQHFKARFGADRVTSDPIEASYNGLRLWANAVRSLGSTDPEEINRIMGRQSVPGPSGSVAVDAATRHIWRPVHIARAQADGQFLILESSPRPVRPVPYPAYRSLHEWQERVRQLMQALQPQPPAPGGQP